MRLGAHELRKSKSILGPVTQAKIGTCMGLSTVDVCRTIREFGHEGMIEAIDHLDNRTRPGMASET
ncbi:MAG: hypothetical protein AAFQ28_14880, partial [Pseudomonadota bacterium]